MKSRISLIGGFTRRGGALKTGLLHVTSWDVGVGGGSGLEGEELKECAEVGVMVFC
jgi:hypothetical protein